jgi:phosphatidylinositol 4-kinase B
LSCFVKCLAYRLFQYLGTQHSEIRPLSLSLSLSCSLDSIGSGIESASLSLVSLPQKALPIINHAPAPPKRPIRMMERLRRLLSHDARRPDDAEEDAVDLLCCAAAADAANDANANAAAAFLRVLPASRAELLFGPRLLQLVHVAACSDSPRLAQCVGALCGASFALALRACWLTRALQADFAAGAASSSSSSSSTSSAPPVCEGLRALEREVERGALELGAWPPPFPSLSAAPCPSPSPSPSPQTKNRLFRRSLEIAASSPEGTSRRPKTPPPPPLPPPAACPQEPSDPRADPFHASLDFMAALVATGAALNRCSGRGGGGGAGAGDATRRRREALLKKCLGSISRDVEAAAKAGVGVLWPVGWGLAAPPSSAAAVAAPPKSHARVLRLLPDEAAVLNSRDKAPFLLVAEVEVEEEGEEEDVESGNEEEQGQGGGGDAGAGGGSSSSSSSKSSSSSPRRRRAEGPPTTSPNKQQQQQQPQAPDLVSLLDAAFLGGGDSACRSPRPLPRTTTVDALDRIASQVGPGGRPAPAALLGLPLLPPPPPSSSWAARLLLLPKWLRPGGAGGGRGDKNQNEEIGGNDGRGAVLLAARERAAVYGESWEARSARLSRRTPYYPARPPGGGGGGGGKSDNEPPTSSSSRRRRRFRWELRGCVVKVGDDCRQELLGMQLIAELGRAFRAGGGDGRGAVGGNGNSFPWVRPLDVVVAGPRAGLVELLADAVSIHTVKQRSTAAARDAAAREHGALAAAAVAASTTTTPTGGRPPGPLAAHFFALYGPRGSTRRSTAQRAYAESLAGYSLATHLLALRDRHNGNILLVGGGGGGERRRRSPSLCAASCSCSCSAARLAHIDCGFVLLNAPGGVRFEASAAAPFKLTRELLEPLDIDASTGASGGPATTTNVLSLSALMVSGFAAARKGATPRRLESLVLGAAGGGCGSGGLHQQGSERERAARRRLAAAFPCFAAGGDDGVDLAVKGVRERLLVGEEQGERAGEEEGDAAAAVARYVLGLLAESMDAFASRQYDLYQRAVNGIL